MGSYLKMKFGLLVNGSKDAFYILSGKLCAFGEMNR